MPADAPSSQAWIVAISRSRAWLFLILLAIFFEAYSGIDSGTTFIFSTFNMQ